MTFAQRLSELLGQPREPRQGFPWALLRLIAPSLTTLEIALAVAIIGNMLAQGGMINAEAAKAITALISRWDHLNLLPNPSEALAIILVIDKGGHGLMTIIEKVIQPLLNAQRELGHSEGRIEGHSEGRIEGHSEGRTEGRIESNDRWRDWLNRKTKAEAEGEIFDEPPPDERE